MFASARPRATDGHWGQSSSPGALTNMKRPVRYSSGRLRYTGRIDRLSFLAWCDSPDGRSVLAPVASAMRFTLFGRAQAARRRLWRQVRGMARADANAVGLQREVDAYLARLETLVHARELPCVGVDLHRLVAVPRLFANSEAESRLDPLLGPPGRAHHPDGTTRLREWLIQSIIDGIERAIVEARPSPRKPLATGSEWILVGVDQGFEWRVPFRGPAWPGHYYLLELTSMPITRAIRRAATEAIGRLDASLQSLSRLRRSEILRQAGVSLEPLLART